MLSHNDIDVVHIHDTVDELQLSHSELIKKCLAIAEDTTTDKRLRCQIYKDLPAPVERVEDSNNSKPAMLPGAIHKMLKPVRGTIEDENQYRSRTPHLHKITKALTFCPSM